MRLRYTQTQRRRQMRYYQAISRGFTPFYQSDSRLLPPLRDFVIAPATRLANAPVAGSGVRSGVGVVRKAPLNGRCQGMEPHASPTSCSLHRKPR